MSRLDIDNFRLVPEVTAALEMLETTGDLGDHETLVFYDLAVRASPSPSSTGAPASH